MVVTAAAVNSALPPLAACSNSVVEPKTLETGTGVGDEDASWARWHPSKVRAVFQEMVFLTVDASWSFPVPRTASGHVLMVNLSVVPCRFYLDLVRHVVWVLVVRSPIAEPGTKGVEVVAPAGGSAKLVPGQVVVDGEFLAATGHDVRVRSFPDPSKSFSANLSNDVGSPFPGSRWSRICR